MHVSGFLRTLACWLRVHEYRIVQNFGVVKLWRIDCFRVLARKMLANLQKLMLATLVNLEFGWVIGK